MATTLKLHSKKKPEGYKTPGFLILLVLIILTFTTTNTFGQCMATPTPPSCNPAGSTALVDNDVVAAGQIKTVNGSSSFSSLTVSGGTLIVCGSLTLTSFTFNSGVIIIQAGATVQINVSVATVFGNNSSIYNWGNFTITGSIVTGQNNLIYNCTPSSVFTVAFNQLVVQGPNTYVINKGTIITSYVIVSSTNSPNPICLGSPSAIVTNFIINQYANAFVSPEGTSCINITQGVINNQNMTATSSLNICYQNSNVTFFTAPFFGSATVNSSCPNCSTILPLETTQFEWQCKNGITFTWSNENDIATTEYVIQFSENAIDFKDMSAITSNYLKGFGSSQYNYTLVGSGDSYYRLKQIDTKGRISFSKPAYVNCSGKRGLEVYPNPTERLVNIRCDDNIVTFKIFDSAGELILTNPVNLKKNITFSDNLSKGIYFFILTTEKGETLKQKVVFN